MMETDRFIEGELDDLHARLTRDTPHVWGVDPVLDKWLEQDNLDGADWSQWAHDEQDCADFG